MMVSNDQMLADNGFIIMVSDGYNKWLVKWWLNYHYDGFF